MLLFLDDTLLAEFGWQIIHANGRAQGDKGAQGSEGAQRGPVDVDALLAGAAPGDNNDRTWRATASLLRHGLSVEETVRAVMQAIEASPLAADPSRSLGKVLHDVEEQTYRHVKDNPELSDRLPEGLRADFDHYRKQGKQPWFRHSKHTGWKVVARSFASEREEARTSGPGKSAAGDTSSKGPSSRVRLRWFTPVDIRTLPPTTMALRSALPARRCKRHGGPRREQARQAW